MIEHTFRPIADKVRFPILTAGSDLPCAHLITCLDLVFYAPDDLPAMYRAISAEGSLWHLYGDTRWPSPAAWVEFDTSRTGFSGGAGVLVLNVEIPADEVDPLDWVARNAPLQQVFPQDQSEMAIQQRQGMFQQQSASQEIVPGPDDLTPRSAQSYCIYRNQGTVRLVAWYTDILNSAGIPIPRYRHANIRPDDIDFCRFALHCLFRLNGARLAGMKSVATPQIELCEPIYLAKDQKNPRWAKFHPSRMLKTRPALRALPSPEKMIQGAMSQTEFERVVETRKREECLETLAYSIPARHARDRLPFQNDIDACLAAYTHRASGGAIYVLPERLVEEFSNTDFDDVRVGDLKLPFDNLFIKFTPPEPLYLAEGAPVDGCYIVKQMDEYFVSVTSYWEGVDYVRSIPLTTLDLRFNLHLPAEDAEISINAAVEKGIEAFMKENSPPTEDLSQMVTRPDGTTCYVEDVRAKSRKRRIEVFQSQEPVFRACLNIIINAACFISFRPEDITEEWDGEVPEWVIEALNDPKGTRRSRDRKRDAYRHISNSDYTRIKICGKNLFADFPHSGATGHCVSPRAHWRRGHWRRQRYGPALAFVIPRWIRPTIVKKDNSPLVESRIYDVDESATDLPPGNKAQ
jgi:hypothetical protein